MIEDYQTYRRGGRIIETVSDKTEGQGPTKDAKIIGMQGEKMPVMPSERPHAGPLELPDDGATGTPCPKCGRPMYDNICFYDDFDKALNATWATIEEGEADGAPLTEQKDLTRQAATAMEHGSGEQGVRYLRRAYILSKETVASHARSKSEGIIKFTWTLFKQVEVMGEDTSMARQMLEKAEAALKAGDDKQARSYAAKADGFLKQLREDGYRKRANDMLQKATAQPMQSAAANDLVEKAKRLIAAKEYEGAVDLLEAARAKK
jgi:hypothetical protein